MQFQSINNKTENEVLIDPTVSNQNSCVHPNEIQSGYSTQPGLHSTQKTGLRMPLIVSHSKSICCPCSALTGDCQGPESFPRQSQTAGQSELHVPPVE